MLYPIQIIYNCLKKLSVTKKDREKFVGQVWKCRDFSSENNQKVDNIVMYEILASDLFEKKGATIRRPGVWD